MLPSMGGTEIGGFLKAEAAKVKPGEMIVELGVFMGAGTVELNAGAPPEVPILCFDRFKATAHEIEVAARFGVELTLNEDTLPRVVKNVGSPRVLFFKTLVQDLQPLGSDFRRPIRLFIDDCCKRKEVFLHAMEIFAPLWIPGETVLVMMDFWYFQKKPNDPELKFQHNFFFDHADSFEFIQNFDGLSCAAFRYLGGLELGGMRRASMKRTICEVLREINDLHQTAGGVDVRTRILLREAEGMAKGMSRKLLEYNKKVFAEFWESNPDYEEDLKRRIDENYLD